MALDMRGATGRGALGLGPARGRGFAEALDARFPRLADMVRTAIGTGSRRYGLAQEKIVWVIFGTSRVASAVGYSTRGAYQGVPRTDVIYIITFGS